MAGDWTVLGYPTHPIPGDPSQVAMMSRYYADVASAINTTASNLRQITLDSEVTSEAVDAFKELALTVASSVNEIDDRYGVVSSALQTYGNELSRVRTSAWQELVAAEQHKADKRAARAKIIQLEDQIQDPATPPANLPHLQHLVNLREAEVYTAAAAIDSAIARVQQLVIDRATAARAAASLIEDECRGSSLNDGTWDKVADFASDLWNGFLDALEGLVVVLDWILDKLEILSFILAVVTLILILSGVGIAVLAIIALVVAAVTLLLTVVKFNTQVVLASQGRTTWAEVGRTAIDVGFAVVGVVTAVGGVGAAAKVATASATVASEVAEEAAVTAAKHVLKDEAGDALFDYLVQDRGVDLLHDGIDSLIDDLTGKEEPSTFSTVCEGIFTDGEQAYWNHMVDSAKSTAEGAERVVDGLGELIKVGV